jgi:hypothetical protein
MTVRDVRGLVPDRMKRAAVRKSAVLSRIVSALLCMYLGASCIGERQVHLLPDQYVGPVLIVYGCEGAPQLEIGDGNVVYRIPRDGILLTSTAYVPGAISARYFRGRAVSELNRIPELRSSQRGIGVRRIETVAWFDPAGALGGHPTSVTTNRFGVRYLVGDQSDLQRWAEQSARQLEDARALTERRCRGVEGSP